MPFDLMALLQGMMARREPRVAQDVRAMPPGMMRDQLLHGIEGRTVPMMGAVKPVANNASGESMASMEALKRMQSMAKAGKRYVVRRGGVTRPLIGPEAVDYRVGPGEEYGILDPQGIFQLLERWAGRR